MKTLKFLQECKYGSFRFYPDCPISKLMQKLIGFNSRGSRKTFTKDHLQILEKMGYTIEVEEIPNGRKHKYVFIE